MDSRSRTEMDGRASRYQHRIPQNSISLPGLLITVSAVAVLGILIAMYIQSVVVKREIAQQKRSIETLIQTSSTLQEQMRASQEDLAALLEKQETIFREQSRLRTRVESLEVRKKKEQSGQKEKVKRIQTILAQRGHYGGVIDGLNGPGTKKAIRAFQSAEGIPANGNIEDKEFVARLQKYMKK